MALIRAISGGGSGGGGKSSGGTNITFESGNKISLDFEPSKILLTGYVGNVGVVSLYYDKDANPNEYKQSVSGGAWNDYNVGSGAGFRYVDGTGFALNTSYNWTQISYVACE